MAEGFFFVEIFEGEFSSDSEGGLGGIFSSEEDRFHRVH